MSSFTFLSLLSLSCVFLFCSRSSFVNGQTAAQNDIAVLNYALTLEHLEAAFYVRYQSQFTPAAFASAGYDPGVYAILDSIKSHELTHEAQLIQVIQSLSGTPVPNCTYIFPVSDISSYLSVAALLENTGVTAYDGAITGITNPVIAQAAATIATVEARHAAYLNQLTGAVPFPAVTDTAATPTSVLSAAGGFIVSCPVAPTAPAQFRPNGVALDSNNNVIHTGTGVSSTYSTLQASNDLLALNYALALENLEAAFYAYGQAHFTQAQFIAAGLTGSNYTYFGFIAAHEAAHVSVLNTTITLRRGTPVPACTYNFSSVNSVAAYVATARLLENTGVMAYDGAVNTFTDTSLEQLGATVATVEARHASYLNLISNYFSTVGSPFNSPFPAAFDNATSPSAILMAVGSSGLLVSCPYPIATTFPVLLVTSVQGDPRFVGFHGQEFQVHGIPGRYFNILSAPQLQVNAKFVLLNKGDSMGAAAQKQLRLISEMATGAIPLPTTLAWTHPGTYLSQIGVKLASYRIYIESGGFASGMTSVTLDNAQLPITSTPITLDQGIIVSRPSAYTLYITTPIVSFVIANSDKFLNIDSASLIGSTDSVANLGGLLGQTSKPSGSLIDGRSKLVFDYLLDGEDIFADDFTANKYVTSQ